MTYRQVCIDILDSSTFSFCNFCTTHTFGNWQLDICKLRQTRQIYYFAPQGGRGINNWEQNIIAKLNIIFCCFMCTEYNYIPIKGRTNFESHSGYCQMTATQQDYSLLLTNHDMITVWTLLLSAATRIMESYIFISLAMSLLCNMFKI